MSRWYLPWPLKRLLTVLTKCATCVASIVRCVMRKKPIPTDGGEHRKNGSSHCQRGTCGAILTPKDLVKYQSPNLRHKPILLELLEMQTQSSQPITRLPSQAPPTPQTEKVDVRKWSKQGRKQAARAYRRCGAYTAEFQMMMEHILSVEQGPARSRHRARLKLRKGHLSDE